MLLERVRQLHRDKPLSGRRIAVLATDGFELVELVVPAAAMRLAGATVEVISIHPGRIRGMNLHEPANTVGVDLTLDEADPAEYDGLLIPGGFVNPDLMRQSAAARDFVRAFGESGKPIASLCHGPWVLASAGREARSKTFPGSRMKGAGLALSPDGRTLACGAAELGRVLLYDVEAAEPIAELDVGDYYPEAIRYTPDRKYLIERTHSMQALVYDAVTHDRPLAAARLGNGVRWPAVSPEGRCFAAGGSLVDADNKVLRDPAWHLVRLPDGHRVHTEPTPASPSESGAFSPDGRTLALGLGDGTIQLWGLPECVLRASWAAHGLPAREKNLRTVAALAFNPDGRPLASGGGQVKLWDVGTPGGE
jgi:putative intracellular protease/amidase